MVEVEDIQESLEKISELGVLIQMMEAYINDQMIQDVGQTVASVLKLVDMVASTDLIDVLNRAMQDPELDKALLNPPHMTLGDLMKLRKDQDVMTGLGIMVALLRAVGKSSKQL